MLAIKALKDPCDSAWQWIRDRKFFRRLRHSPPVVSRRPDPAFNPKCFLVFGMPIVVALGVWLYLATPTPTVRIVLHATAEAVVFKVANPDQAAFRVAGMRALAEASGAGDCLIGVIQPADDVTVQYALTSSGKPTIRLSPPSTRPAQPGSTEKTPPVARYTDKNDQTRPLDGLHHIVPDETCEGSLPQRFPILGTAEFGREYAMPTATLDPLLGVLTDARLTFYAKSPPLFFYPSIYEWKKLEVPSGSRVGAIADADDRSAPVWRGLARFDRDKERAGYIIDASITARGIRLTIPGMGDQDSQIVFDKFSPLTSDPNWIALQLYGGFGIWLIVKFFELWRWFGKRNASKNATD